MGVRSTHILTLIDAELSGCSLTQYAATLVALQEEIGSRIAGAASDLARAGLDRPYVYEEEYV